MRVEDKYIYFTFIDDFKELHIKFWLNIIISKVMTRLLQMRGFFFTEHRDRKKPKKNRVGARNFPLSERCPKLAGLKKTYYSPEKPSLRRVFIRSAYKIENKCSK